MSYSPPGPIFAPGVIPDVKNLARVIHDDPQAGLVKKWSYSTLKKFEQCPHAVYLAKVMKLPRLQHEAAGRGEAIHKKGEDFITGADDTFPIEYERAKTEILRMRDAYLDGTCFVEDEWAFSIDYEPVGWDDPRGWGRMKLDVLEFADDTCAIITDWKTGRKFGNEMSHGQQLQLYTIAAMIQYPALEYVRATCQYLDRNESPLIQEYTRAEAMSFRPRWTTRAVALTSTTQFPPKPSKSNCRFCDYRKEGCEWSECK